MKRIIFFLVVVVFTLSSTMAFASNKDRTANSEKFVVPVKSETTLSDEDIDRITKRVEEIRQMDKSDLPKEEMSKLKRELKEIKENVKKDGGPIYIGGATLLLIIILVILLV